MRSCCCPSVSKPPAGWRLSAIRGIGCYRRGSCSAANATEFAMNFGMFGLSFMLALYTQQILHYSAVWSAVALLPISIMLLLVERFGR